MAEREARINGTGPNIEQYTEIKNQLSQQILKKQELEAKLLKLEDSIYEKESEYFNESVYGNIVKGFENFAKSNVGGTNKKRIVYSDEDHIFSLSSTNYIKGLLKRQGLTSNGTRNEDFDDYEDSVDPNSDSASVVAANSSAGQTSAHSTANASHATPGRKRKMRTIED